MNKKSEQPNNSRSPNISTQPYKGARDLYPEEMRAQNYIFDTWRKVCKRYGFEEYDFPILEPFEIFAAKTGEEIVNEQMFNLTDGGGRKLSIRPELTPGTVRMIADKYEQLVKPLKWFMIGNNWRYEKPQKGRGREFNQLEVNIFGIDSVIADFEIFSIAIDIMKAFGANEKQFKLLYSDRKLILALLRDFLKLDENLQLQTRRLMDKKQKMSSEEFRKELEGIKLDAGQIDKIESYMNCTFSDLKKIIPMDILSKNKGYKDLIELTNLIKENNLDKFCAFSPSIIRGFDYSDGIVYEVFDINPDNNRSMFGGERFDNLVKIFGDYELPATGYAMGDYTLIEFLKAWKLLPTLPVDSKVLVTIFDNKTRENSLKIAQKLRENGINTYSYLEPDKLDKQLKYADRVGIPYVVIIGPDEIKKKTVQLKDMKKKKQEEVSIENLVEILSK